MLNRAQCAIGRALKKPRDKLNILTAPTHERYEGSMCLTGHEFWAYRHPSFKKWKTVYAPVPANYHLLNSDRGEHQIPSWLDIDVVLSQNKAGQFQILKQVADYLNVPLISMEHTLPMPQYMETQIRSIRSMMGDIDVFVSEYQRQAWGYPEDHGFINHTGIDTEVFRPLGLERQPVCLSINNDWINRDWCCGFTVWKTVTNWPQPNRLPVRVVGDTPGLSAPAKDIGDLVNHYNTCAVYLNTTTVSSLPTVILEAMACGTPVVSTATCLIPKIIIDHGVNGFVSNDPNELKRYCQMLLNDKKLAEEIGMAGREKVLKEFSLERFIETWNKIFYEASRIQK